MVETDVILITNGLCAKSRAIREKSIELGIEPKVIDLAAKPETAEAYATCSVMAGHTHLALSSAIALGVIRL